MLVWPLSIARWSHPLVYASVILEAVSLRLNPFFSISMTRFSSYRVYTCQLHLFYSVVALFFWVIQMLVIRGVPFPILVRPRVSFPLNSGPVAHYRKGGTTPRLKLSYGGVQLSFDFLCFFGFCVYYRPNHTLSGRNLNSWPVIDCNKDGATPTWSPAQCMWAWFYPCNNLLLLLWLLVKW